MRQVSRGASCRSLLVVLTAIALIALAAAGPIGGSNAKADCSEATARQLVDQYHLNDFLLPNPVVQVLCGSFTGASSEAMAITIGAPTCWGIQRWAVFSFTGGAWQLVLNQHRFIFPLAAVGSTMKETSPVFRPGDPHCLPSGGKQSRIWHWDGTRLVAGPWKKTAKAKPKTVHIYQFRSPSHNLLCLLGDEEKAYCSSKHPPHSVSLTHSGKLHICSGARCVCSANCSVVPVPTLRYGQQDVYAGFRCLSLRAGVRCTGVRSGKGFLISRSGVRRVGTRANAPAATHTLTVVVEFGPVPRAASWASSAGSVALVTSSPAGIDCPITCSAQFEDGTTVALTGTSSSDWAFAYWRGDCSGQSVCVVTMDRDRTVEADYLSTIPGRPYCRVPRVVGMLRGKAVAKIERAHCRPGRVSLRLSSKARKNHVLAQSQRPGKRLRPGAKVNLTVGKGPKRS